jgi:hypothetical protein
LSPAFITQSILSPAQADAKLLRAGEPTQLDHQLSLIPILILPE